MPGMEAEMERVWVPEVRPLAAEAASCYNTGSVRASIVMVWVAVCADITAKMLLLAEDGDPKAIAFQQELLGAQQKGLTKDGINAMQEIEKKILDTAFEAELIDSFAKRDLDRIREDRHLCAHPSPRDGALTYIPRSEVARSHLAVALEALLAHPPMRGKRLQDAFATQLIDPLYVPNASHILAAFYDRVQNKTRRRIVEFAVKHALLELQSPGGVSDDELARRMAACVEAFLSRDRSAVRDAIVPLRNRFRTLDSDKLIRAIDRMGAIDEFWEIADEAIIQRLNDLVDGYTDPPPDTESWQSPVGPQLLSLTRIKNVRSRLSGLEARFNVVPGQHLVEVFAIHPDAYFAPRIHEVLSSAWNFRMGEVAAAQAAIPHGPFMSVDQLGDCLAAWAKNEDCREASRMPGLAVAFYRSTAHLRGTDATQWHDFLTEVRQRTSKPYYQYTELEAAINAAAVA